MIIAVDWDVKHQFKQSNKQTFVIKDKDITCAQMEAVENEALVVNNGGAEHHWQEGEETQGDFHLV